jgi:peptidoglycan/LPS O-acetylase OafA/YrhL
MIVLAVSGRRSIVWRIVYIGCALGILWVSPAIVPLFPVWLAGAFIRFLPESRWFRYRGTQLVSLTIFIVIGILTRLQPESIISDYAVGLGGALSLYAILHRSGDIRSRLYRAIAREWAGFSFTLYASHLPMLIALISLFSLVQTAQPTMQLIPRALGFISSIILVSFLLARITEHRTTLIRERIRGSFHIKLKTHSMS